MRPGQQLTDGLMRLEDDGIDGAVDGTATVIAGVSGRARRIQNGFVRTLRPHHGDRRRGRRCRLDLGTAGVMAAMSFPG